MGVLLASERRTAKGRIFLAIVYGLLILGGLTMDDAIAFPYGPDAHEGAHTQKGDLEKLYAAE